METKQNFTIKVVRELLANNFSVLLHNTEKLEDNCGGWCWIDDDENKREFAVAMKHHMGFEILIHEYCHFLQWKTDRKFWDSTLKTYDTLFDWIADPKLEVSEDDLQQSLTDIISIEHDCEKRVLKMIKNNPIEDFDTDKYIRAVNSYIWSYHINKDLRKRPLNPIYSERVLPYMPIEFHEDVSYYLDKNNLTSDIRNVLLAEYQENSSIS
jgi:hypothetical protein